MDYMVQLFFDVVIFVCEYFVCLYVIIHVQACCTQSSEEDPRSPETEWLLVTGY